MAGVYVPRSPTIGVLYGVVRERWSKFAATIGDYTDGVGLPSFVIREFRKFLRCGVLAHGFARIRCGDRGFGRLRSGAGPRTARGRELLGIEARPPAAPARSSEPGGRRSR